MNWLKTTLFYLISALLFMGIAFYNEYPLMISDSEMYIFNGFWNTVGKRGFVYSFFIKHISLKESLWFVVFAQALILAYVLNRFIDVFQNNKTINYYKRIIIFSFLVLFTGVSWYCSQIMTDIFTPIAMLASIILMLGRNIRWIEFIGISVIYLFAILTHKSHFLLFSVSMVLFGLVFLVFNFFQKYRINKYRYLYVLGLTLSMWIVYPFINYLVSGNFTTKSYAHVFLMGRLVESGMLERILDDKCPEKNYVLCQYKDDLPQSSRELLWTPNSPLQEMGWDGSKEEFNDIILASFKKPRYILIHISDGLMATFQQLTHNKVGRLLQNQVKKGYNIKPIKTYYPYEFNQFKNSLQNNDKLDFDFINTIRFFVLSLSLMLITWFFYQFKRIRAPNLNVAFILVILYMVMNAASTAPLTLVSDRYQGRVIWLVPFIIIMLLIDNDFFAGEIKKIAKKP